MGVRAMTAQSTDGNFGNCCENLKDAMQGEDFEPLIAVDDDGILYMSVGLLGLDGEEHEANTIDYPIFFCPFCGTKLQTPEQIDAKASSSN
jgi:hypothetical protein